MRETYSDIHLEIIMVSLTAVKQVCCLLWIDEAKANIKPIQPNSFELADAILKSVKKKLGTPFANPFQISGISRLWKKTILRPWWSVVLEECKAGCLWLCRPIPPISLRPHHTTITTNHNMPKNIPPRNKTPAVPTKRLPKTPCPHLPTRKDGLISERQREGQELYIRRCWNHIKSEPRT